MLMPALSGVSAMLVVTAVGLAASAPSPPKQAVDPRLETRLARIESAFRQRDANALRLSLPTSGKVRVDLGDLTDGQGSYGPGQLQVIFGQIFEDYLTREFAFDRDEVRVSPPGTAFVRGHWIRRQQVGGHETVDTLTFTVRQEGSEWRIQEIRSTH